MLFQLLDFRLQLTSVRCSAQTNQTRLSDTDPIEVIPEFLKLRFSCLLMVLLYSVTARLREHLFLLVPLQPFLLLYLFHDHLAVLSYLVPNGVCQIDTEEFMISQDDLPTTSRDTWKRTQGPPFSYTEKFGQSERSVD